MKTLAAVVPILDSVSPEEIYEWLRLWTLSGINNSDDSVLMKRLAAVHELSKIKTPSVPVGYRVLGVDSDVETWQDLDKYLHGDFPESVASHINGIEAFLQQSGAPKRQQFVFRMPLSTADHLVNVSHLIHGLPKNLRQTPNENGLTLQDHLKQREIITSSGSLKKALHNGKLWVTGKVPAGSVKVIQTTPRKLTVRE